MSDSPSSLRKRQAKYSTSKLQEEVLGSSQSSLRNKSRRDAGPLSEFEERLISTMTEIEAILGPSMCSLCDRDISKSIKIKCLECIEKPVFMCLECLRTGKTSSEYPGH